VKINASIALLAALLTLTGCGFIEHVGLASQPPEANWRYSADFDFLPGVKDATLKCKYEKEQDFRYRMNGLIKDIEVTSRWRQLRNGMEIEIKDSLVNDHAFFVEITYTNIELRSNKGIDCTLMSND